MRNILDAIKVVPQLAGLFFRAVLFKLGFSVNPYKICWLLTWRCNLSCHYCELGQANQKELKDKELTLEEIKRIAPQFKKMGVKFITFAGGEPLIYEDIFKVLGYCKDLGFVIGLVTNATLISEENARRIAECGVDHIQVSLDYPGALHDRIRNREHCFEHVDAGIKNLLKYKHINNYHIGVVEVVSGMNYDKLEELFRYAEENKLDSVSLQPFFINQMRTKELCGEFSVPADKLDYLGSEIKRLMRKYPRMLRASSFYNGNIAQYFRDPKMKGTLCFGGGLTTNIFPDGTVGSCYYLSAEGAGNLTNKSLKDIINTSSYAEMLKRVRARNCPTCWCAVVHEYNIFFRPLDCLRSLRLLRVAKDGR